MKRERSFFLWLAGALVGALALVGGAALIKHDNKLPEVVVNKSTTPLPLPGTVVVPGGLKNGVHVEVVPGSTCEVQTRNGKIRGSLYLTPDGSKLCLPYPPIATG